MLFADLMGEEKVERMVQGINKYNTYICTQSEARAKIDYVFAKRYIGARVPINMLHTIDRISETTGYTKMDVSRYALYCMLRAISKNKYTIIDDISYDAEPAMSTYTIRVNNRIISIINQIAGKLKTGVLIKNLARYLVDNENYITRNIKRRCINNIPKAILSNYKIFISDSFIDELPDNISMTTIVSTIISYETFTYALLGIAGRSAFKPDREFKHIDRFNDQDNTTIEATAVEEKSDTAVVPVMDSKVYNMAISINDSDEELTMRQMVDDIFNQPNCYLSNDEGEFIVKLVERVGKNNISIKELKNILAKSL